MNLEHFQQNNLYYSSAAITCPVTATTAHVVIVNQTGIQLDDLVTLACEPGYHHVSGSTIRTCLWTRDWSGAPITCEGESSFTVE